MRKIFLPAIMTGTLLLGGCAAGGMGGNPLGGILGSVLSGGALGGGGVGTQGSGTERFERAAVDACGQQASQYGRVSISQVEQRSRDTVLVNGSIESRDRLQRQFTCTFRSDGRIIDFRTG